MSLRLERREDFVGLGEEAVTTFSIANMRCESVLMSLLMRSKRSVTRALPFSTLQKSARRPVANPHCSSYFAVGVSLYLHSTLLSLQEAQGLFSSHRDLRPRQLSHAL